jgi:peptidoglycan-associated lipoprotein
MYRDKLRMLSLALMAGALALTVACGKKQPPVVTVTPPPPVVVDNPPPPPPPQPPPPPPPAPQPSAPVLTEEDVFARMTLGELNEKNPLEDVLFAYDSADLSDAGRASLQKSMTWLQRWVSTRVTVEGHADSRGTNEYNLALGERRAASVRDYLVSLGISASRVSIVSKGEEQPTCTDETEACWTRNRRGHFVFTAK